MFPRYLDVYFCKKLNYSLNILNLHKSRFNLVCVDMTTPLTVFSRLSTCYDLSLFIPQALFKASLWVLLIWSVVVHMVPCRTTLIWIFISNKSFSLCHSTSAAEFWLAEPMVKLVKFHFTHVQLRPYKETYQAPSNRLSLHRLFWTDSLSLRIQLRLQLHHCSYLFSSMGLPYFLCRLVQRAMLKKLYSNEKLTW